MISIIFSDFRPHSMLFLRYTAFSGLFFTKGGEYQNPEGRDGDL